MTDKKFTDEEIIRNYEWCIGCTSDRCRECTMDEEGFCEEELQDLVLDLINRQRAEIERLGKKIEGLLRSYSTAEVTKIKHGKWIEDGYCDIPCVCSCCGTEAQYTSTFKETFDYDWEENLCPTGYEEIREYIRTPFCSNCGAKMDGGN